MLIHVLMLWTYLALQVCGVLGMPTLPKHPEPKPTNSVGSDVSDAASHEHEHHGGPARESIGPDVDFKTPVSGEMSKGLINASVKIVASTSTPDPSIIPKILSPQMCTELNSDLHIPRENKGHHRKNMCAQTGAVVNSTFRFLHDIFDFADCRDRTLLQHRANTLYCAINQQHQVCQPHVDSNSSRSESKEVDTPGREYSLSGRMDAQNTLLSSSQVRRAMYFLCHYRRDLNKKCVLDHLKHVEACIQQDIQTITNHKGQDWSYGILDSCRHLEVTAMCTHETLEEACTESEARIMTSLMVLYLNESQCSLSIGNAAANSKNRSYMNLLLFVALLGTALVKTKSF